MTPRLLLVLAELQQLVQRAALLVGGGELQVLELHPDLGAGDLRQRARMAARRALDMTLQPVPGREDVVEGEGHGEEPAGVRKGAQPNGGLWAMPQCGA